LIITDSIEYNTISNNAKIAYSNDIDLIIDENNTTYSWNTSNIIDLSTMSLSTNSWSINLWSNYTIVVNSTSWLASWKTLTIKPGNIFKFKDNFSYSISWKLLVLGSSSENVIFTSYNDNSVWISVWSWTPIKWAWSHFYIYWTWTAWTIFDYVQVKYASLIDYMIE